MVMNLKDWEALSRKQREAFWKKATPDERRSLVEASVKRQEEKGEEDIAQLRPRAVLGDSPLAGVNFEKATKPNACTQGLLALRDTIRKELQDEEKAAALYAGMAKKFNNLSHPVKANILQLMSGQEALHRYILESIAKDITNECGG